MRWSIRAAPTTRFPFKGLASCGVAFYLAAALRTRLRVGASIRATLLDLVALGTIADMVPLIAENRILVAAGLRAAVAAQAARAGGAGRARRAERAARSRRTTPRSA